MFGVFALASGGLNASPFRDLVRPGMAFALRANKSSAVGTIQGVAHATPMEAKTNVR